VLEARLPLAGRDPPPRGGTSLPPTDTSRTARHWPTGDSDRRLPPRRPAIKDGYPALAIERCSDLAEPLCAQLAPVWELVASIPAPRCDHVQYQDPALTQHDLVDTRIVLADLFERMGEVEFDRPTTTRLKAMNNSRFFVVSTLPGFGSPCGNCSPRCSLITRLRLRNVSRPPRSDDRCRGDRDLRRDADRVQTMPGRIDVRRAWITREPRPCVPVPPPCSR
jgi:hypothetical protein